MPIKLFFRILKIIIEEQSAIKICKENKKQTEFITSLLEKKIQGDQNKYAILFFILFCSMQSRGVELYIFIK